ncbi:hypothetical protein [Massilia sp. CF038]|uniref:DUF7919 family protein n=1 Tax=Massilia sp. CF038 TaxID=1881045 RepID=UPI000913898F|nr:hypothetical protein [Massilia sp. CF038]SHG42224.1 hypothetical protein SAMN05428948_0405 [Massilia sp. CF038]
MTYFRDLELIDYHNGPLSAQYWQCPLLAIGWLEAGRPVSKGSCAIHVVEKLVELRHQFAEAFPNYSFRGLHACTLCVDDEVGLQGSHINLFIPGEDAVYLATGRVDHYIEVHGYAPPPQVIAAILNCPDPRSAQYAVAMLRLNRGERPPLFPERWRIFKVDANRVRMTVRIYEMESEAEARKFADMLASRDQSHEYDVERVADPWVAAD